MRNQKVSIVHVLYSGSIGGMQRAIYQLAKHMATDSGLDITVAFAVDTGPFVEKIRSTGVNIWVANLHSGWDFAKLWRIWRFMTKFDIHHFHTSALNFMLASCLCRRKFRVYTNRGGLRDYPFRKRVREAIMGVFLRHFFSAYSGNTSLACDTAATRFSIPRKLFRIVYNGLDFGHIKARRARIEIIQELGLEEDIRIVGTSACLKNGKRVDKLIHLAAKLESKTKVLILGDGPHLEDLKRLAHDLSVSEKVIFSGMKADPFDYVNAMDVFVLPSGPEESFGNSAVEAMALGIPTVVFEDGGGLVEHIVPNVTGYVVNDDRDLHEIVSRLLDNPPLRIKVGEAGQNYVRTKYSVENMISAYCNLYGRKYTPDEAVKSLADAEYD